MAKLKDRLIKQEPVLMPWHVSRLFFDSAVKNIQIYGDQASFGGDYAELKDLRKAITWFVDELGGKVEWDVRSKENKRNSAK